MKTLFAVVLVLASLTLPAVAANQLGTVEDSIYTKIMLPGVYPSQFNGGSNAILGASTNFYFTTNGYTYTNSAGGYTNKVTNAIPSIAWRVVGHATAGLSLCYNSYLNTATNGSNVFKLVRSYDDGLSYESTPFLLLTNIMPTAVQMLAYGGSFTNTQVFDLTLSNATHVGIIEIDSSLAAAAYTSNVSLSLVLPAQLTLSYPATH